MLFRQLFDSESSTYTYLLADEHTRDAVIVDPVLEQLSGVVGTVLFSNDRSERPALSAHPCGRRRWWSRRG